MELKSMALTAQEAAKTMLGCSPSDPADAPKYPWGLSIDLNDATLGKLGITELPAVGAKMRLMAEVEVTRVSAHQDQGGTEKSVGLQITSMAIEPPAKDTAAVLYPSMPKG